MMSVAVSTRFLSVCATVLALALIDPCALAYAGDGQDAGAPESAAPISGPDTEGHGIGTQINRILKLMGDGDAKALFDLYQSATDPIVHAWAAMAVERVRFNLDAASHDAQLCEDKLLDSHPAIALLCGQFRAGDLRLAGRAQAALDLEVSLAHKFESRHVDARLALMRRYLDVETEVPQMSIDALSGDVTIALQHDKTQPTFDVAANGREVTVILDTGATDLVLGAEKARELGVKLLDQKGHTRGWVSKDVPIQRGVLETLKANTIVWHNVPVRVVPNRIALLGGNLLAPLGTIALSRHSLQILDGRSNVPACEDEMITGTDLHGRNLRVLPSFAVNGVPQTVLLDTGSHRFLLGTKAALDEVTRLQRGSIALGDVGGHHAFVNAEEAKIRMTISHQPFDIHFVVLSDSETKYAITLGADALRDMDFVLDFRHQHLCFPMHGDLH